IAGLVVARRLGFPAIELQATSSAVGAIAASFWLWALAGRLRAGKATLKSRSMRDSESVVAMCQRLAVVLEGVASGSAILASAIVLAIGSNVAILGAWGTFTGVGVILSAALLQIALVPRWEVECLVYLAQGLMVGAYLDLRFAYPLSMAGDAAILTL